MTYLPPNVTCRIQPMDQEIIQNTKERYRTALLKRLILNIEAGQIVNEFPLFLLDALSHLVNSWNKVTIATIQAC